METTTRLIGDKSFRGFSATTICIVEQLGFEIIFLFLKCSISCGLTSGTIRGTSGSILKEEVLSITIQPFLPAIGAHFSETEEPAENNAISTLEKSKLSKFLTLIFLSPKFISLPSDRLEAKACISSIANSLSESIDNISCPTAPVAPTTATL